MTMTTHVLGFRSKKKSESVYHKITLLIRPYVFQDLPQWITSVYSSKFRKVVIAMLSEPFEFLARELEKSMGTFITDDEVISEVRIFLQPRPNFHVNNKVKGQMSKTTTFTLTLILIPAYISDIMYTIK